MLPEGKKVKMGSPKVSPFLIGLGQRFSGSSEEFKAVYGYNALKAHMQVTYPSDIGLMLGEFHNTMVENPGVLFLRSMSPKDLHDMIKRSRMRVWDDRLTRAAMGVCIEDGRVVAVGYSYPKAVENIMLSQQNSGEANARLEAMEFLDRNIIPANLGDDTPYFITPVN